MASGLSTGRSVAHGAKRALRRELAGLIARKPGLATDVVRLVGTPTLQQLHDVCASWHADPASLLVATFPERGPDVPAVLAEAKSAMDDLTERAAKADLAYPAKYGSETGTLIFLYAAVRLATPSVLLETGVASGLSTEAFLQAMSMNGHGSLHSVDIADDVGTLVTDRTRWTLHIAEPPSDKAFSSIVDTLPMLDFFYHDADHRHAPQLREYETVWPRLRSGGLLGSDDIDASYAFIDFSHEHALDPLMLVDRRKVMGVIVKK